MLLVTKFNQGDAMALSNKERQKLWKERQKSDGKKMITIMLSDEAYNLLNETKKETGELFPNIIERAILKLKLSVTSNAEIETVTPKTTIDENPEEKSREEILSLIVDFKENKSLSFEKIAYRLNEEGIKTFSGTGKWHGKTINKIYARLKNK